MTIPDEVGVVTPTVADVERMEARAWDSKRTTGEVVAALLLKGFDEGARDLARQWEASQAWWVEAAQQVRDVRRVAS